jgi:hypothetical protein
MVFEIKGSGNKFQGPGNKSPGIWKGTWKFILLAPGKGTSN